eukprot:6663714-Alexandrium_andersonii.AAC.1
MGSTCWMSWWRPAGALARRLSQRLRVEPASGSTFRTRARRGGLSSRRSPYARALRRRRVSPGRGPRVSRARKSSVHCV